MTIYTAVADFLLYAVFSYLAGSIVLKFVPDDKKPRISESKALLLICVAGIAFFSLAPLIELAFFLNDDKGWARTFLMVLIESRIGHGWLITLALSLILGIAIFFNSSKYNQGYYLILLILVLGYFSHVASLSLWAGFASHSLHFFFMTIWAGVLLHIAWFSTDNSNWRRFLAWFTPYAIFCMVALLASGIFIMLYFVEPENYANSWVLPYGQLLLLKHISIIPLLAAAFINGFLNNGKGDRVWLKVESFLLFFVFLFTAFMSKQAPPHEINHTLRVEGAAPLVVWLKGEQFIPIDASIAWSTNGVLLLGLGGLLLGMMILSSYRQVSSWLPFLFSTGFIVTVYMGLMLNVSF
ncbi:putative copper resistance protein D [Planomicrobium soli]|uniref:Putative copper resistance protein D n=1 Tax=Planomicrobium soli TaxID=1176648 RepID=A0A2P8FTN6_9BACL|nr:CopD family protein [Planomicrobium soli]PSL25078.1 putative copper resistance protein D [Planomicrobium soli]